MEKPGEEYWHTVTRRCDAILAQAPMSATVLGSLIRVESQLNTWPTVDGKASLQRVRDRVIVPRINQTLFDQTTYVLKVDDGDLHNRFDFSLAPQPRMPRYNKSRDIPPMAFTDLLRELGWGVLQIMMNPRQQPNSRVFRWPH